MSHSHICRQRQSTAFLCAFACFLSEIWPNPSPFFVRVASYWSEGTKYNTVLTLLHSFSSPFPPFWFAFKEKKFVFWFLHQVSNSTRVSFPPPLPIFPSPFGLSSSCCVLTFPFSLSILTVTSLGTLSQRVSLVWYDFDSYVVLRVVAVTICLTTLK